MSMTEKKKDRIVYGVLLAVIIGFLTFTFLCREPKEEVSEITNTLIPKPLSYESTSEDFEIVKDTKIVYKGKSNEENEELKVLAISIKNRIKLSTGYDLLISEGEGEKNFISLNTVKGDVELGDEGYKLVSNKNGVEISSIKPEGIFRGIQTLRQLLPPEIEKSEVVKDIKWTVDGCNINDKPRYEYRGVMLDVARHFFTVDEVKRQIDLASQYKINKFHMHLSDDQGWRLEIKKWPELTNIGGATEVGGSEGGYYTQEDFKEIVRYANERYIEIIPEFDMPGHTNAMLASYGFLNPDGEKRQAYTGIEVGISTLMCRDERTYEFIEDIIKEVTAISPSRYFHIGGDEALKTSTEDYNYFIARVSKMVEGYGKTPIGWDPSDKVQDTSDNFITQLWSNNSYATARKKGIKMIVSKAENLYMDMKYDTDSPYGLSWAGLNPIDDTYNYDPTDFTLDENILGIEATLWTETINSEEAIDYMVYPKLISHSEIGWSQRDGRSFEEYKLRLKEHGERLDILGVKYRKDKKIWD